MSKTRSGPHSPARLAPQYVTSLPPLSTICNAVDVLCKVYYVGLNHVHGQKLDCYSAPILLRHLLTGKQISNLELFLSEFDI